jgi:hypothetical protein
MANARLLPCKVEQPFQVAHAPLKGACEINGNLERLPYIFRRREARANKNLFQPLAGKRIPATNAINEEKAPAYALAPKHALAQYAATAA